MLFATGIFLLGRAGFAAGLSAMIVTTCVLGVVTLGRKLGFVMIVVSAAAHAAIGLPSRAGCCTWRCVRSTPC